MKIKRTLYNPYNHLFEVYFEDGVMIDGTYIIETRNQTDSGIVGTFINVNIDKDKYCVDEYNIYALKAVVNKISSDIQKYIFKEFYK